MEFSEFEQSLLDGREYFWVDDRKILSEQLLEWIALLLLTLLKSRTVSICLMLYGKV